MTQGFTPETLDKPTEVSRSCPHIGHFFASPGVPSSQPSSSLRAVGYPARPPSGTMAASDRVRSSKRITGDKRWWAGSAVLLRLLFFLHFLAPLAGTAASANAEACSRDKGLRTA